MTEIVFIDCEASSLNSGSFITELGWAVVDGTGGSIRSGSCLIRPLPKWLRVSSAWDPKSEKLTGISKERLERDGIGPTHAVQRLAAEIGDGELYSDEPAFDAFWLQQVIDESTTDLGGRKLGDAKKLIAEAAAKHRDPKAALIDAEQYASTQITTRHRAEPDALRLALIYRSLLDRSG